MNEVVTSPLKSKEISALLAKKHERYKYVDFSFLDAANYQLAKKIDATHLADLVAKHRLNRDGCKMLVFVNGYYMPDLSDKGVAPGVTVTSHQSRHDHQVFDAVRYPFASINAAHYNDGACIHVSDNCHVEVPIHILSIGAGVIPFCSQTRNHIIIGKGSKIELVYEAISDASAPYTMNDVDVLQIGENALVEFTRLQHENNKAIHFTHTFVTQGKDSLLRYTNFAFGANFYRDDIVADLAGTGADCKTAGLYQLSHADQFVDNHIDINHQAEHTHSEMLYKGVLSDKSKAVFNGRLHVEKGAQKIVAYQENHNILLSRLAEVYSKPELEIYADDVKCKHGATTGQIDEDALFYMRARGVPKATAMNILLQGFAQEVLLKVSSPVIRERIKKLMSVK